MSEEWLKNLKVDDSVFVVNTFGNKSLNTVQKVTPTGRIVVNNTLYTDGCISDVLHGRRKTSGGFVWQYGK